MKVLHPGREQKGWAKEAICMGGSAGGGCRATLLVEEADLEMVSHCDYLGDWDHTPSFRCGSCGVRNYFKSYDIPAGIRRDMRPAT